MSTYFANHESGQKAAGFLMAWAFGCVLVLFSGCASPPKGIQARILKYGIYEPGAEKRSVRHPEIPSGKLVLSDLPTKFKATTDIPGRYGTHFGYTFEISGLQPTQRVELELVTYHPLIVSPQGRKTTRHSWKFVGPVDRFGRVRSFVGYSFDEIYGIVPGEWTMAVKLDDQYVLNKKFRVFSVFPFGPAIDDKRDKSKR
jgi:hypothetical protein